MQKKKILLVITKSNWGGAQRYVYDLATHMSRERYEITVAFGGTGLSGSAPGKLAELIARENIRTIFIPELGRDIKVTDDYRSFRALLHLFQHERPDIVHLNSSKVGGLGAAAARFAGVPRIVFTAHGWPFWEERPLWQRAIIYFGSYLSALLTHATIVIHQKDMDVTRHWPFLRDRLHLVHNGISEFPREERERAREILAGEAPGFWLGTIAELHPSNNLSTAIDAVLSYNHGQKEKLHFVIIGAGEEQEKLTDRIKKAHAEDEVMLAGFQPNAASLLSAFDAFLFAPKKTGLPYVLLEAGFVGLPVITNRNGGIPDIIEDGVTGILLPRSDAASIKHALKDLFSNYSRDMGDRLKEKVLRDFSLERCIAETAAVYEN